MMRGRRRALVVLLIAALAAAAVLAAIRREPRPLPPRAPGARPALLLLTSLPLLFSEDFSLQGGGSPALRALAARYRVVPISVTDPPDLAKGRLLLMAQPQAQTAENLVLLDHWVRGGGRLLLLADPMLEWPSRRPPGDLLRPPAMFMDTGLLAHWGLRLDAPDKRGAVERQLGDRTIVAVSPGSLTGRCVISRDRLVARCAVGRGMAVIVADADLLNAEGNSRNLAAVVEELARLEPVIR